MRKSYQSSFTVNPLANSNITLVHPLDALHDSSEFHKQPFGKGVDKEDYMDMITLATTTRSSGSPNESVNRKPLAEKDLLRHPFVFGCCHNSTYVGCAGVCPETCQYRSKYCMPLCGPPCRCKRGYVYNIDAKACTLRTDCPKGIVQSRNGVYRVFL
ncbi:uncharacterized protein Dwil_GK19009 [Drosophila willistoni]|uniref:TIL domain-containing protein n=2 Tax=Drosophila willistoni TaxID=7260 RepID=B4MIT2_DROWI|nr:uncharacterized protein Dwil_GK19009 [Drosophila willistoni]